jgi:hypothetical protein
MNEIGSDMKTPLSNLLFRGRNKFDEGVYPSTGRDCLEVIIKATGLKEGDVVLFPSYLCPEILTPFKNHNIKFRFYKVNKNLIISSQDFLGEVNKGDVRMALIINYFGFPDPGINDIRLACEKAKVLLVEDCAQSTLSKIPVTGELAFYTYRKTLPVPDGAHIKGLTNLAIVMTETPAHKEFVKTRLMAGIKKNFPFTKNFWRKWFIKAENELINGYERPAPMSRISKRILSGLNLERIFEARRINYLVLLDGIRDFEGADVLYPDNALDDDRIMPFGMPIICSDTDGWSRDYIKDKLIKNKIYPPIHWKLPEEISRELYPESHWLSEHILTIPVDQRYDGKDMIRIIEVLKK